MRIVKIVLLLVALTISFGQIPQKTLPMLEKKQDSFRQAIRLEKIGELEAAETIYLELLEVNPKNTRIFLQLKALYRKQEKYEDLKVVLLERVRTFNRDLQSHVELGEVFLLMDEREKAKQYWNNLRFQFGETRSIYYMLIQMYLKHNLDEEMNELVDAGRKHFDDPSFLSLELGNIHMRNLDYSGATEEFVTYASYHPEQIRTISSQILRMSDREESHQNIEKALMNNRAVSEDVVRLLYSDFLFKVQRYPEAYNQHLALGVTGVKNMERWIRFAHNLRKEQSLPLALKAFTMVLDTLKSTSFSRNANNLKRITGEALYGLALTYEQQITPSQQWAPLAEYFPGNMVFKDHLTTLKSIEVKPLEDTFSLYDSILVTLPSTTFPPQAHFRLGEIKYKITRDFDGAMTAFSASAGATKDRDLALRSNLRLADVFMAKSDFSSGLNHLRDALSSTGQEKERQSLKFKLCQVHFLYGNIDSTLVILDQLLSSLELGDPYFNDALELKGFIEENYVRGDQIDKDAFQSYILAERLLRQGKRSEADSFFRSVVDAYPETPIADEAAFRRAQLTLELGNYTRAVEQLAAIQDSPLGDLAAVMTGEVYDRYLFNNEEAEVWYFKVLEEYPESLLTEPVRYRLREITKRNELN